MDRPLLPVVKPEIGFSIEHGIPDDVNAFIKPALANLWEENPVVAEWIERFSKITKCKGTVAICGLVVYKLLHSQAEADRMAEEIHA